MIALEPNELANRFGLAFAVEADDLDEYQIAAVKGELGHRLHLVRYRGNPVPGTIVYVDVDLDPESVEREIIATFDLADADISWRSSREKS